jgi:hypothetical protein
MIPKRINQNKNQVFYKIIQEILIAKSSGEKDMTEITQKFGKPPNYGSTYHPKDMVVFESQIEAELYVLAQETCHRLTGRYWPMEELVHLLVAYFVGVYSGRREKRLLPFVSKRKGVRYSRLIRFHKRMSQYYPTIQDFI